MRMRRHLSSPVPIAVIKIDALSLPLAFAGVGAIVGQGFAACRVERSPRTNTTRIIFCWTAFGFALGCIPVALDAVT
jgi:hypothetical protein